MGKGNKRTFLSLGHVSEIVLYVQGRQASGLLNILPTVWALTSADSQSLSFLYETDEANETDLCFRIVLRIK